MISVGIDVSKGKSMICMLKPYGEVLLSPNEISHTQEKIIDVVAKIKSYDEEIRVIMKATGAYYLPLLTQFVESNIFVSIINPLVMKKYASATIRNGKTDKLDSVRIANYGIDNWFKLEAYQPTETIYAELNMLGRQYSHYVKMRIKSKLALTNLLDRTMQGIKTLLSSKRSDLPTKDKLCDFVAKYWHYDNISKMNEKKFILSYSKCAKEKGYHQSESKAKAIYALSQNGIPAMPSNSPSPKMLALEAIRVLQEINKTLEIILTQLHGISSALPEYEVVRKMNGVGKVLVPRLIAEIGDVRRFHSGSALIAFAGIDAPPYQSGKFVGTRRHISKRGSSLLRKTGYEVMKRLKTVKPIEDAAVYQFILKKESEGKSKKVAKIAGLNKFLRIYYARVILSSLNSTGAGKTPYSYFNAYS